MSRGHGWAPDVPSPPRGSEGRRERGVGPKAERRRSRTEDPSRGDDEDRHEMAVVVADSSLALAAPAATR